jgi:hypothetical protein
MSPILKKSSRKERRIPVKGICRVGSAGSQKQMVVQINDLSAGGMNFSCKAPVFTEKSVVDIQIIVRGQKTLFQRGRIVYVLNSDRPHQPKEFRFAVQFERRLSEDLLALLLESLDFQGAQSENKS